MASIQKRGNRWFAPYRDNTGHEHGQRFDRKIDAQRPVRGPAGRAETFSEFYAC